MLQLTHDIYEIDCADPLREASKSMFLISDASLTDRVKKEQVDSRWNLSPREMMQKLGTDCMREHFGNQHWVKLSKAALLLDSITRLKSLSSTFKFAFGNCCLARCIDLTAK
jgi:hypothetical protein